MTSQQIPTKEESPLAPESPPKRQKVGITLAQKQALIDNLQLERMYHPREEESAKANDSRSYGARP